MRIITKKTSLISSLPFISTVIAIIASVVTIYAVYHQLKTQKTEIQCLIQNYEKLTLLPNVSGLKADFSFNGRKVNHLWKINLVIQNTGDYAIIGEGSNKNIVQNSINFKLPENLSILNLQKEKSDFPCDIAVVDSKNFKISFSQWKIKERLYLFIYTTAKTSKFDTPPILTLDRDLINGNVRIIDQTVDTNNHNSRTINSINPILRSVLLNLSFVANCILIIISIILIIVFIIGIVKLKKWKKKNYKKYVRYINSEKSISRANKEAYIKLEKSLSEELWKKSGVPSIPKEDLIFDDTKSSIIMIFVVVIIIIGVYTNLLVINPF